MLLLLLKSYLVSKMKKFSPSPTYEGLLQQAHALYMIANSKERQVSFLNRKNDELRNKLSANNNDALRDTIEKLTNLLEPNEKL